VERTEISNVHARSYFKVRVGPCGLHVFNRKTGLNVLLDEVQVPPNFWANAPRHVSIALTNVCDLACSHCFAPKNQVTLDFEKVISWLDDLDKNGCLGVGFGGGEPTLYPRLVDLCRYASEHTDLAVTLTTHAHHLNDELAADLTASVHFLRISMDGVGATYEAMRGQSFSAFCRRLESVRSIAPFGINYLVNSHTLIDLDAATAFASEIGAVEFLLLPEEPVNGIGGIDADTARALQRWASSYRGNVPLTVSEKGAEGLPVCNPLLSETGLSAYAHIDATGILKRSSFDGEGIAINEEGVMEALNILHHKEDVHESMVRVRV
jgi:MoaA/NifB/PqqE/SkfB family radical SAM enzyme